MTRLLRKKSRSRPQGQPTLSKNTKRAQRVKMRKHHHRFMSETQTISKRSSLKKTILSKLPVIWHHLSSRIILLRLPSPSSQALRRSGRTNPTRRSERRLHLHRHLKNWNMVKRRAMKRTSKNSNRLHPLKKLMTPIHPRKTQERRHPAPTIASQRTAPGLSPNRANQ